MTVMGLVRVVVMAKVLGVVCRMLTMNSPGRRSEVERQQDKQ